MSAVLKAVCEVCGREFYGLAPRKFCDVPTCQGYLLHILRASARAEQSQGNG